MQTKDIQNNSTQITNELLNYRFLNSDSSIQKIELSDKCPTLVDFYFVGCSACKEKTIAFDSILNLYREKIKIISICNGRISSFQKFKEFANKENKQILHLYCPDLEIKEINGYPFEILFSKNKYIINSQLGYNKLSLSAYISNLKNNLNK